MFLGLEVYGAHGLGLGRLQPVWLLLGHLLEGPGFKNAHPRQRDRERERERDIYIYMTYIYIYLYKECVRVMVRFWDRD